MGPMWCVSCAAERQEGGAAAPEQQRAQALHTDRQWTGEGTQLYILYIYIFYIIYIKYLYTRHRPLPLGWLADTLAWCAEASIPFSGIDWATQLCGMHTFRVSVGQCNM
jgi:hypothetical protein